METKNPWKYYKSSLETAIDFVIVVFTAGVIFAFCLILGCDEAHAQTIDMQKIAQIESSGCKEKFGKFEHARGCWQITKPVITEWNQFHPKQRYTLDDMLDDTKCLSVASWYVNKRIPALLKHFGKEDTVTNRLIAYNAGIKAVINGRIPKVTRAYLKKYGV